MGNARQGHGASTVNVPIKTILEMRATMHLSALRAFAQTMCVATLPVIQPASLVLIHRQTFLMERADLS
jgi:hypothetical protein